PSSCLSFLILPTTSPSMGTVFFQSVLTGRCVTTYFVARLMASPVGSVAFGQKPAKMSYVFRPRSRSKGWPICSPIAWPTASSKRGIDHPPYLKPPLESSSGPPGACITPSSVTNVRTISFLMFYVSLLVRNVCQSRLRGRRKLIGRGLLMGLRLASKPHFAEEERSDQRQYQHGSGIEEHVVQGPSE